MAGGKEGFHFLDPILQLLASRPGIENSPGAVRGAFERTVGRAARTELKRVNAYRILRALQEEIPGSAMVEEFPIRFSMNPSMRTFLGYSAFDFDLYRMGGNIDDIHMILALRWDGEERDGRLYSRGVGIEGCNKNVHAPSAVISGFNILAPENIPAWASVQDFSYRVLNARDLDRFPSRLDSEAQAAIREAAKDFPKPNFLKDVSLEEQLRVAYLHAQPIRDFRREAGRKGIRMNKTGFRGRYSRIYNTTYYMYAREVSAPRR